MGAASYPVNAGSALKPQKKPEPLFSAHPGDNFYDNLS